MPSNPDPSNSGKFSRPIDAPSLPPWRNAGERTAPPVLGPTAAHPDDETPTLSGDAFPVLGAENGAGPAPQEDPRDLARRLAAEAKQKAGSRSSPAQETNMRADDPRELARRLADEAKRRLAPREPVRTQEPEAETDPGEPEPAPSLRSRSGPPSLPILDQPVAQTEDEDGPTEDPGYGEERYLDDSPGEAFADDGYDGQAYGSQDPEPSPDLPTGLARGKSLAERAGQSRPSAGMSAAEALAAARLAEARAASAPPRPQRPPAPAAPAAPSKPAPSTTSAPAKPAPSVSAAPRPAGDLSSLFGGLLPGATIEPPVLVTQLEVFRALWRAHRARANHDQQLDLVCTSSVLLDAADRGVQLAAARVTHAGTTHAVFVDVDRRTLLGAARPAEIYLAGL